ncbi:GNAT family N-acetyltransferase [Kineococcus sp. NPDC059986]|uniref:GNAT family N-acetyltransferase n=1 Tax=Kineococcus sp. NPDC059986 TaxID=3155538 RepID=UPI0034507367
MTGFALPVDDDLDLVLREEWTVAPLHAVVLANLEHLRRWEVWARGEQTLDGARSYARYALGEFAAGTSVPTALRFRGRLVGACGARIDPYGGVASVGYWVDAAHQGLGLVSRAAQVLVRHLHEDRGLARVEIRTAVDNVRSRAVAERLGFTLEGVLRSAQPGVAGRDDLCVFGHVEEGGRATS